MATQLVVSRRGRRPAGSGLTPNLVLAASRPVCGRVTAGQRGISSKRQALPVAGAAILMLDGASEAAVGRLEQCARLQLPSVSGSTPVRNAMCSWGERVPCNCLQRAFPSSVQRSGTRVRFRMCTRAAGWRHMFYVRVSVHCSSDSQPSDCRTSPLRAWYHGYVCTRPAHGCSERSGC